MTDTQDAPAATETDQPARPATGAESADPRLRAYAAVFAYIQQLPAETTYLDPITRNAVIWRAVHAALDVTCPEPAPAGLRARIATALEAADYRPDMQRGDLADAVLPVVHAELEQQRARVRHVADQIAAGAPWTASHADAAARVRAALQPPTA